MKYDRSKSVTIIQVCSCFVCVRAVEKLIDFKAEKRYIIIKDMLQNRNNSWKNGDVYL